MILSPRLESAIEESVGKRLEKWGRMNRVPIYFLKLHIIGKCGWPDRLILWPNKGILFVEFKRVKEKPSKLQLYVHGLIRKLGFEVLVIDSVCEGVPEIIRRIEDAKADAEARAVEGDAVNCVRERCTPVPTPGEGQNGNSPGGLQSLKDEGVRRCPTCHRPT